MPTIYGTVIPTGGAISLDFATASGAISLSRATSGASGLSAFTVLYAGPAQGADGNLAQQYYLDTGDQLPGPLSAAYQWVYRVTDSAGTAQTPALMPVSSVTIEPDPVLEILMRLLQAGIQNITPPAGIDVARVTMAMPLATLPPLPLVVIAPELDQMEEQPIGVDAPKPDANNSWQIFDLQKRVLRVSILSLNSVERDYYKVVVISIFKSILGTVLQRIGQDVRHGYQAASYQQTRENADVVPGFYGCDVMLEVTGTFSVGLTSTYGIIAAIDFTATEEISGAVAIQAHVPTA